VEKQSSKLNKIIFSGGKKIEITRPDKVLFPEDNLTKTDVVSYYQKIASWMLPHLKDRPLVMHHFPDGIKQENFYQKQIPDYFPKWIRREQVKLEKGGSDQMVIVKRAADLIYLANQAVITSHIFLSKAPKLHFPDKVVFDLDPSKNDLKSLRFAARAVKEYFEKLGHKTFIMISGIKGYHVVVVIKPTRNFDSVREAMKKVAGKLSERFSDLLTDEIVKEKREGRIFLDYLRNSYGQISVTPYSLRAVDGAPVATPIDWNELDRVEPQSFNIKNIFKRVSMGKDPWEGIYNSGKKLDL